MVRLCLGCRHSLEGVVFGVDASAGSVLGDAILVVDMMTIVGTEERVFGPFGIIGEFPFQEVFVERLLLCGVDAEGSGDALDASFGEAVGGRNGSFGEGFVFLVLVFVVVVGVVVDFYLCVSVFGFEEGVFDVR